jgi:hypothetical protein
MGAACTDFVDLNTVAASPLYIVSGSQPQSSALNQNDSYNVSWVIRPNVAATYELRFSGNGTAADANTSGGTDRTITIRPDGNLSFMITNPPADNNTSVITNTDFLLLTRMYSTAWVLLAPTLWT